MTIGLRLLNRTGLTCFVIRSLLSQTVQGNTNKGKAEGHIHSKSGGGQLTRGGKTGAHTVYGREARNTGTDICSRNTKV
jgi:hypothetical protein